MQLSFENKLNTMLYILLQIKYFLFPLFYDAYTLSNGPSDVLRDDDDSDSFVILS